ncbi:MAG: Trm112 family protein [Woeseiales bacterium]
MDKKLLEILVCPSTKVPVRLLSNNKLAILNNVIARADVRREDGSRVESPLNAALITEDGKTIYVIDDEIPIMLEELAIAANQVAGW